MERIALDRPSLARALAGKLVFLFGCLSTPLDRFRRVAAALEDGIALHVFQPACHRDYGRMAEAVIWALSGGDPGTSDAAAILLMPGWERNAESVALASYAVHDGFCVYELDMRDTARGGGEEG